MNRAIAIVAMAACSCFALSQTSQSFYFDAKESKWSAVVMKQVTTVKNVLGNKKWALDIDAFVGAEFSGNPVAGLAIGKRFPLADKVDGYLGIGARVEGFVPSSPGPVFGIAWKF